MFVGAEYAPFNTRLLEATSLCPYDMSSLL